MSRPLSRPTRVACLFQNLIGFAIVVVLAGAMTVWLGGAAGHAQGFLNLLNQQKAETPVADSGAAAKPETARTGGGAAAPAPETASETAPEPVLDEQIDMALSARDVLLRIFNEVPTFPATMATTLRAQGPDGTLGWIPGTFLAMAAAVAAGFFAMALVSRWGRAQFAQYYVQDAHFRADKLAYLFFRALMMFAALIVFVIVSGLLALFFVGGLHGGRETAFVVIATVSLYLGFRIVFLNLLVPDAPSHRLFSLADEDARGLYRSLLAGTAVSAFTIGLCMWMQRLGLPQDAHKLALISASFLSMVILSVIAAVYRKAIGQLIRGQEDAAIAPLWRRVLAGGWHIAAILYFVAAWAISAVRILLDLPDATGLVGAPLLVLLTGSAAFGALILIIDRLLLPRLDTPRAQASLLDDIQTRDTNAEGEQDLESAMAQARAEAADREASRKPFRDLLDKGAALIVVFGGLDLLASSWGVQMAGSGSFVGSFIEILLIGFIGYMAYEAVKILIDQKIAQEKPEGEKDEEIEIGGTGESRIATLLPIFRNFLLITIVVISAMVVLSELGVNIAPLFAGAGVVGLAIGFGAQTLIRDIFSGAFYLIDDAFRRGEYIDIGSAKGTVEKISIRSMQLRHHRGALTTIPFGEIQHVQNFSRDWAMMKLGFRVTYDTDVDKMRKIIKKFGQELLDDPYYGPMFLQPLKSQGILAMEDSAMIARVKFMTKPGKQYELRKVVYAGLRDLFQKNGIEFANRQVTVRVATSDDDEPAAKGAEKPSKLAAAGAAAGAALAHEEEAAAAGGNGNDQL